MNKPVTKRQLLYDPMVGNQTHQNRESNGVAGKWESCLISVEFQFGKMEHPGD